MGGANTTILRLSHLYSFSRCMEGDKAVSAALCIAACMLLPWRPLKGEIAAVGKKEGCREGFTTIVGVVGPHGVGITRKKVE